MSTNPLVQARETRQLALWERTAAVAGRLNRAQAELVQIAAELITDRHWGDGGFKTPEHYLVVRAGLSPGHASDIVQVAKRRTELTEAAAALDAGELSLDQVAVIARNVPPGYTTSVTHLARNATVTQLRRATSRHAFPATTPQDDAATPDVDGLGAVRAAPQAVDEQGAYDAARDAASEQRACARADLSMSYDSDGRFQLRYSAPATIGALVEQAVKEAKDALFLRRRDASAESESAADSEPVPATSRDAQDPRAGLPTYADALEEMATRSLATVTSTSRSSRYRVYLHLSTDGAWINGGHAIPLRLLTRFITDGKVQPVWETEGRPISVGRSMRILPDRTRRLIPTATAAAGSPAAPPPASSRSTTSTPGPTADPPTNTTRPASAPSTTTPSTAATTPSPATPPTPTDSPSPTGTAYPSDHPNQQKPPHHPKVTHPSRTTPTTHPAADPSAGPTSSCPPTPISHPTPPQHPISAAGPSC